MNLFHQMMYGQINAFTVSFLSLLIISQDSIIIERLNEMPPYNQSAYSLADVIYHIKNQVKSHLTVVRFISPIFINKNISLSIKTLQEKIKKDTCKTKTLIWEPIVTDGRFKSIDYRCQGNKLIGGICFRLYFIDRRFSGAVAGYFPDGLMMLSYGLSM